MNIQFPPLTKTNKALIIAYVSIFLISQLILASGGPNLNFILGLKAMNLFSGQIWQLITFPFVSSSLMGVIFDSLLLWWIGSELEATWGEDKYRKSLLIALFAPAFLFLMLSFLASGPVLMFPLLGPSLVGSFQFAAYATLYPDRRFAFMMIFPIQAKYFILLIVAIEFFGFFSAGVIQWPHIFANLAALGLGYLFVKSWKIPIRNKRVRKSHLRVVPNEDSVRYFQ